MLHQRKFKIYSSLKYKPTLTVKEKKIAETGNTENHTYAEVTHADRNPARRLSKTNNAVNKHKQNIHEKLRLMSPTNKEQFKQKTIKH